jgi:hypothetical protein
MKGEKAVQALAWTDSDSEENKDSRNVSDSSQAVRQASSIHYVVRVKLRRRWKGERACPFRD